MRLRILLGFLVIALIAAILVWFFQPLQVKSKEDKGGVPVPTATVLAQSTETPSVGAFKTTTAKPVPTTTPKPLKGRPYTNKAGGYSLVVPDGWRVSGNAPYTIFLVRESQQREGEQPSFRVQVNLSDYGVLVANLAKGGTVSNTCTELRHSTEVDGFSAERWACGDSEVRRMYVTVQRDDVFYWLGGAIAVKDWERDFPIFEGILASIEFIPIEKPPPVTSTAVATATPKAAP